MSHSSESGGACFAREVKWNTTTVAADPLTGMPVVSRNYLRYAEDGKLYLEPFNEYTQDDLNAWLEEDGMQ
jgi:hypothetical protein